jgi:predicted small secreted protein
MKKAIIIAAIISTAAVLGACRERTETFKGIGAVEAPLALVK